jgi:VIT1/CCC1 family predicted Fe2+/Mn2+ transporter
MPIEIQIEDADLEGLSDPAKDSLKSEGEQYIKKVIQEANRLESSQKSGSGPVEITKAMIDKAAFIQKHAIGNSRTPILIKLLRVASAVLSLIVGILYDATKLQNETYVAVLVTIIALAILTTTLATLKD